MLTTRRGTTGLARAAVGAAAAAGAIALVAPLAVFADAARAVTFAATLAAVGLSVFGLVVDDRRAGWLEELALRRAVLFTAVAGILAGFAGLAFQVADVSGRGVAGLTDGASWRIVFEDGSYASVGLRALGLAFLAYVAAARWHGPTAGPLTAFGAGLGCAWSMVTGHPATSGPHTLVHAVVFLHVAAAAVWFGGLIGLGVCMRHRRLAGDLAGGAAVVARFSRLMTGTVAALLAGGTVLGWFVLGGVGRLTSTSYGLVLLAKLALAAVVLVVGAVNHRRLVPAVRDGAGWPTLARTIAFEQGALVMVLAVTAVLVSLDPHA